MKTLKEWMDYIVSWRRKKGFKTDWLNIVEKMWLVEEELHEAGTAHRHMDPKFLEFMQNGKAKTSMSEEEVRMVSNNADLLANFKEELADTAIRLLDLAGSLEINLDEEIEKKMAINEGRPEKHGKAY